MVALRRLAEPARDLRAADRRDHHHLRRSASAFTRLRASAFTAWIIGAGVATLSNYFVPGSVDAIVGTVVASVVFWSYEKVPGL
ncbi:hypothetical protein KXR83_06920 [Williamsia muralis]|uniref:hypothetical protein n=1 Tax=Williamsia marianensis TaxID=85044 RepID=UPI003F17A6F3